MDEIIVDSLPSDYHEEMQTTEIKGNDAYNLREENASCEEILNINQEENRQSHSIGRYDHIMCNKKTSVYVKVNKEGFITSVNSEIFIDNLDGWIKIDEGEGDRFVHAQTQYYDEPLIDEFGNYRFKM